jgi:hypothetical protein
VRARCEPCNGECGHAVIHHVITFGGTPASEAVCSHVAASSTRPATAYASTCEGGEGRRG